MNGDSMSDVTNYSTHEGIGILRLDDGEANAMQAAWCSSMNDKLDRGENDDTTALILCGRQGFFSAGLDLKLLPTLELREMRETTDQFMETMKRVFLFPKPVIAASAGHAIAGGMMLFLCADYRVALDDDRYRYGLNEAVTGIPFLGGTAGICQYAIPRVHHNEMLLHGRMLSARECLERQVVHAVAETPEAVDAAALARAIELRDVELGAYQTNKLILRREVFDEGVRVAQTLMSHAPKGNVFEGIKR
jgi:enoyl-CoA hydratase/carnithine racemase